MKLLLCFHAKCPCKIRTRCLPDLKVIGRISLVVPWLRIHLPTQRAWFFNFWSGKTPHSSGQQSLCTTHYWAQKPQLLKPARSRALAPQGQQPLRWAAPTWQQGLSTPLSPPARLLAKIFSGDNSLKTVFTFFNNTIILSYIKTETILLKCVWLFLNLVLNECIFSIL